MLEFRRTLAFSSRIHTYLMVLYLFFASLIMLSFFTDVADEMLALVTFCANVLSWLVIFEGVWIILACVYQMFYTKVAFFSPVVLTLVRGVIVLAVSTVTDALQLMITRGVTI